ncbi:hypothetical protein D9757_013157 [Collybiopsis confluens]|uniref:O-fucosyltransferase family protein n=1 Tax=Collybiopsis confluens TaxID=2823264 RepID=A0A8H5DA18_9AGAR|nr:hypothetical protein D9757_013157 [Collybiopsis confluens]
MSAPPPSERSFPTTTFRNRSRLNSGKLRDSEGTSTSNSLFMDTSSTRKLAWRDTRSMYLLQKGLKIKMYLSIFVILLLVLFVMLFTSPSTRLDPVSMTGLMKNTTTKLPKPSRSSLILLGNNEFSSYENPPSDRGLVYNAFRTSTVPVVYRTVLERLDRLWTLHNGPQESLNAPKESSIPFLETETESLSSSSSLALSSSSPKPSLLLGDICEDDDDDSALNFEPSNIRIHSHKQCRFLLPLRIAEQESKARIHLLELIQTAKHLGRILVLPHVGKSRLGVCFKWGFDAYYDEDELRRVLKKHGVRAITLEVFKTWLESRAQSRAESKLIDLGLGPESTSSAVKRKPTAQLVSLGLKKLSPVLVDDHDSRKETQTHGLIISVDSHPVSSAVGDSRFPGCFGERFGALMDLREFTPMAINPSPALGRALRDHVIGAEVVAVLNREDIRNASRVQAGHGGLDEIAKADATGEPDIFMLDWGLRYPIYSHPFEGGLLSYSPLLKSLAQMVLSPQEPYLFIHWRMEGVPTEVLKDCANDLVDTVAKMLHTPELGDGIEKVWFAGDYAVPIGDHIAQVGSRDDIGRTMKTARKSGTFDGLGAEHGEAVDILVDAFREGGELEQWVITDLTGEMQVRIEGHQGTSKVDPELLKDSGVLGILDKMIGMEAAIFIGGGRRCGRTSSFTKQVIDSRRMKDANHIVRNVVEYFG